jgi:dinuclear metal center YbgI/SA1388 family protein
MTKLATVIEALDAELNTAGIQDYPGAHNGLQLTNASGNVSKVAVAVDACLPVVQAAVAVGADLLIVHHGMFWSGVQPIQEAWFQKLKTAMDAGLAIYSNHLPLDYHATLGNDVGLARAMGYAEGEFFGVNKGLPLGWKISTDVPRQRLLEQVQQAVGGSRVHCAPGGPEQCRSIAILTGSAGAEVGKMPAHGIDTLVTGEGPHHTYTQAEELGINLIYAGHYATETFGVKALGAWLERQFGLPWQFLHHPTGL